MAVKHSEERWLGPDNNGLLAGLASLWHRLRTKQKLFGVVGAGILVGTPAIAIATDASLHHPPVSKTSHAEQTVNIGDSSKATVNQRGKDSVQVHAELSNNNLSVNGQSIPVPQNGTIQKQITNGQGKVTVTVHGHSVGLSTNSNSSSTNISVQSEASNAGNSEVSHSIDIENTQ